MWIKNDESCSDHCSNHTGELFAALNIVSNCAAGLDRAFHWVDFGSSGYKLWTTAPLEQAFFAPVLLHTVAQLGDGVTFALASVSNPDADAYAWSTTAQQVVVTFNRRAARLSATQFKVALLADTTEKEWSIGVYAYNQRRTVNATQSVSSLNVSATGTAKCNINADFFLRLFRLKNQERTITPEKR